MGREVVVFSSRNWERNVAIPLVHNLTRDHFPNFVRALLTESEHVWKFTRVVVGGAYEGVCKGA